MKLTTALRKADKAIFATQEANKTGDTREVNNARKLRNAAYTALGALWTSPEDTRLAKLKAQEVANAK